MGALVERLEKFYLNAITIDMTQIYARSEYYKTIE